jgi:thiamine biosynthesis lipoprotein
MSRSAFRAMGVEVVVGAEGETARGAVRRLVHRWDRIFSRFREGSELNRVNASPSDVVAVSETFARATRAALAAVRATDGLVDPTIGAALRSAGYDRDFELLGADPRPTGGPVPGTWRLVSLTGRLLSRPRGTLLDLNGVVKGLVVDEALRLLPERSFVSAGGDLATSGDVVVALPGGSAVRLESGGLATSGETGRRWLRGGVEQHHLIDPRTGCPARSRWDEVTVAASSCLSADVAASAAFLLSGDGPGWLDERGLPGRFLADGTVFENDAWRLALSSEPIAA